MCHNYKILTVILKSNVRSEIHKTYPVPRFTHSPVITGSKFNDGEGFLNK